MPRPHPTGAFGIPSGIPVIATGEPIQSTPMAILTHEVRFLASNGAFGDGAQISWHTNGNVTHLDGVGNTLLAHADYASNALSSAMNTVPAGETYPPLSRYISTRAKIVQSGVSFYAQTQIRTSAYNPEDVLPDGRFRANTGITRNDNYDLLLDGDPGGFTPLPDQIAACVNLRSNDWPVVDHKRRTNRMFLPFIISNAIDTNGLWRPEFLAAVLNFGLFLKAFYDASGVASLVVWSPMEMNNPSPSNGGTIPGIMSLDGGTVFSDDSPDTMRSRKRIASFRGQANL